VQIGIHRDADLPDVPLLTDLFKPDTRQYAVARLVSQALALAKCFGVPPGTPPDRVAIVRQAFDQAVKDPDLLAQADKQKLEISPLSGDEVSSVIKQALAAPADIKSETKAALGVAN